ncbi:MAG: hypothetical protein AAF619_08905 [Pseudomonadota bacterium]
MGWVRAASFVFLGFGFAACAQTGDFGRPKPSFFHTVAAPYAGKAAQLFREEPTSFLPLTDAEEQMRRQAFTLIVPFDIVGQRRAAQSYARYHSVLPQHAVYQPIDSYYRRVMGLNVRSSETRLRRVIDDMRKDRSAIPGFVSHAGRVLDADGLRLERTMGDPTVDPRVGSSVDNRTAENGALIWFTVEAVEYRLEQYRYAIDQLAVVTPSYLVAHAERALKQLTHSTNHMRQALIERLDTKIMARGAPIVLSSGDKHYPSTGPQEYSLDNVR